MLSTMEETVTDKRFEVECLALPAPHISVAVLCLLIIGWITPAFADVVVPSADVTTGVTVRASASSQSASVGILHPGEQATLLGSVPNWQRVQLANGVLGYVSKRWTQVVTSNAPPPPPPPSPPTPAFTIDVVDVGTARGQVFRTDLNDATCGQNPAKIGPDNDGKAGGCDNVRITIPLSGPPAIAYWRGSDSP